MGSAGWSKRVRILGEMMGVRRHFSSQVINLLAVGGTRDLVFGRFKARSVS